MKTIFNYITEKNTGTPDKIVHNKKIYEYDSEYAVAIIYNIKHNTCLWSKPGETHNDILFNLNNKERRKLSLYNGDKPIRYVDSLSEGDLEKENKCGRIWVIPNNKSKHRKFDVYIAWWNELSENQFYSINEAVLKQYNKDFNQKLESFICVDNNGNFILIDPNKEKIHIDKRDETRQHDVEVLKAIHLASQNEKAKFFAGWKAQINKAKDKELQKLGWRDKDRCYAKRNNMFAKHIVKDENTGKYKVVYGAKIGDSLIDTNKNKIYKHNMKSLIEYILERKIIGFGEANPKYGQCIILAGGAASGKGFIQKRIDMQGKVFDVDELKKKYQKLAKAGVFKDEHEYDLSNPDDVALLHQKVKETGMKSKERNNFWRSRAGDYGNSGVHGDKKHSSGLLPNIIFDMVSDDIKDVESIVTLAKGNGYNVTLVWVVCNQETAVMSNAIRGIDAKGKARSVPQAVIEKGHKGAYKTITDLLNNKYEEVSRLIDVAWVGLSSGWGRMLNDEYSKNPVIKIKKNSDGDFSFNQNEVDTFLKKQQPINYDIDDKEHTSLASYRDGKYGEWGVKKYEYFIKHADDFDESKMPTNETYNSTDTENPLIEALTNAFKEENII